jgi:hypothetical protein
MWSSASPIVECHCVHVCAFAHEELNNMQMPALSSRVQSSEALSAKVMGQEGIKAHFTTMLYVTRELHV